MFHTIFQQPDAESVWAQARDVVEFCQQKFPDVADYWKKRWMKSWRLPSA